MPGAAGLREQRYRLWLQRQRLDGRDFGAPPLGVLSARESRVFGAQSRLSQQNPRNRDEAPGALELGDEPVQRSADIGARVGPRLRQAVHELAAENRNIEA